MPATVPINRVESITYVMAPAHADGGEGLMAIIIPEEASTSKASEFLTPENGCSLQLGLIHRKDGDVVAPHYHPPVTRNISGTPEVLVIRSGQVILDLYTHSDKQLVHSYHLSYGDIVLLLNEAGHGLRFLSATQILEVKQGPYAKQVDKLYL